MALPKNVEVYGQAMVNGEYLSTKVADTESTTSGLVAQASNSQAPASTIPPPSSGVSRRQRAIELRRKRPAEFNCPHADCKKIFTTKY